MNADERAEIAQQFGVAPEQVERDHLISHLLHFSARTSVTGSTSSAAPPLRARISRTAGLARTSI
jgi:hypothetical protein